jgi:hypothetical protein
LHSYHGIICSFLVTPISFREDGKEDVVVFFDITEPAVNMASGGRLPLLKEAMIEEARCASLPSLSPFSHPALS